MDGMEVHTIFMTMMMTHLQRPDLIAPGTGFFIYAASDTNVSFTEAMQVHSGGIGFHGSLANGSESPRSAKSYN